MRRLSSSNHDFQMTFHRLLSLIAMAFLWTGSQIPVYIFGMLTVLSLFGEIANIL
jgi:hypothetical protein